MGNWLHKLFRIDECGKRNHYFLLRRIGSHHSDGKLHWPCERCGKVFLFDYGLQAESVGKIKQAELVAEHEESK